MFVYLNTETNKPVKIMETSTTQNRIEFLNSEIANYIVWRNQSKRLEVYDRYDARVEQLQEEREQELERLKNN